MAMIKCSECGKDISDKAVACVNCGAPIQLQPTSDYTTIPEVSPSPPQSPTYPQQPAQYSSPPPQSSAYSQQPAQYSSPPQQTMLTLCPYCKKWSNYTPCEHCGTPIIQTVQQAHKKKQLYRRPWFWIIVIFVGFGIIGALASSGDDTPNEPQPSPVVEATPEPTLEPIPEPTPETTPPLEDTTSVEEDLSNLQKALNFTLGVADGLYVRPSGIFDDDSGEYAGLVGTLTAYRFNAFLSDEATQTYRTFYYALYWRDAYIAEFGEDEFIDEAERQIAELISESEMQSISDSLDQIEVIREEVAALDEQEFKDSAQTISYDNLIRRPDDYEGEIIKVTVRITQIFDKGGLLGALYEKGFAGTQSGNEWIIIYELPEGASRILEGDTVTFYGVYDGVRERQRAIGGASVHIPHMTASYHS